MYYRPTLVIPMLGDQKISVCSFKLETDVKRRFDAAMRLEGTTMSETIRNGVLEYLNELDKGVEHPQFRLELQDRSLASTESR
jgi:hypothetical protein